MGANSSGDINFMVILQDFAYDFFKGGSCLQALSRALSRALSCRRGDVLWRSDPKTLRLVVAGEIFPRWPAQMSKKARSRLMRLSPHSDSGSDLEAEDARDNWRINAYNGVDKARDKARDKKNSHANPGSAFMVILQG